jgi:glutaredoxin
MTHLTLYGKPGCCLCDEAKQTVTDVTQTRNDTTVEHVDISTDPVLHAQYGERIPVVEINGADAFELHVDAKELTNLLDTVTA